MLPTLNVLPASPDEMYLEAEEGSQKARNAGSRIYETYILKPCQSKGDAMAAMVTDFGMPRGSGWRMRRMAVCGGVP